MSVIEQVLNVPALWWARFDTLPVVSGITAAVVAYLRMRNEGKILWSREII